MRKVFVFGIRHHGPGSARSLNQALHALAPDMLLVEGPPDAQEILPWVGHADLRPPVALLVYVPDLPHQAVYYPFAIFSPEWQALQYARASGTSAQFIDLPYAVRFAMPEPGPQDLAIPPAGLGRGPAEAPPGAATGSAPDSASLLQDPLNLAAEAAGYSDGERWWEHVVEQRQESQEIFTAILELMAGLRTEAGERAGLALEAEREAHMRQAIRQAIKDGYQRIAVVCGAWHAPALMEPLPPAAGDASLLKGLARVKTSAAWVPWSYGRLAWESGYGAGIQSPGWYEHLWLAGQAGYSVTETTVRWLGRVARLLREAHIDASSAQVIDAVRLAEALAALRDLPLPGLPELNEAVRATFGYADDLPLRLVREKLVVNEKLGSVPEDAPVTPLQADLARQQKRLRLQPEASHRDLDLDLRQPNDLERSYLLHRLDLLGIPWGELQQMSAKSGTFHEYWRVQWQPELAMRVVSASQYGNTVQAAAAAYVQVASAQAEDLAALTRLLHQVLLADLPTATEEVTRRVGTEATLASDLGQLMDALPALADVLRYGNVRKTNAEMVRGVVDGLVSRICIGLPQACASLDDDAAELQFRRINKVQQAIQLLQDAAYRESWLDVLLRLAEQNGLHGLVAGRCCRLLLEQGVLSVEDAARWLGLALSLVGDPLQAGAWVQGFLRDSGAILVQDDLLWAVLDQWVAGLQEEVFIQLLPLLRRTFSTFTPPERRAIGERARRKPEQAGAAENADMGFDEERAGRVLPLLRKLLGVSDE